MTPAPTTATKRDPNAPVLSLIGNTPLVPLRFKPEGITLLAKCEFLNPSGSIKDRLAKTVLVEAIEHGRLRPDSIILECTSGNTGIALSMVGAALGYHVTILMSSTASEERRSLIRQLGAELILFESGGMYQTGIELSRKMAAEDSRYFLPRQFENPLNVEDHEHGTGQEILQQVNGPIDAFVTGFGTGGTLAGCGKAIKRRWPKARIVAMEPAEQALLAGECDLALAGAAAWLRPGGGGPDPGAVHPPSRSQPGGAAEGRCRAALLGDPDALAKRAAGVRPGAEGDDGAPPPARAARAAGADR